jgi:hypothetical protein
MPLWGAEHRLDTRLGQGLPQSVFSTAYNRAAQVRSRDDPDFKASILGRLGTLPLDTLTQLAEIMLSPAQSAYGLGAGRQARETGEYLSQEDVSAMFNPDSTEALMAERDRLQQQLQTADEEMAQEIMAQIMEINKELEMAAAPGMAGGGVADLQMQQLQQFTRPRLSPTVAPNWFSGADRRKRNQHLAARGLPMRHQGVPIPYARPVPPWGG